MMLKQQEKLETSFFSNKIHFPTRKCILPKIHMGLHSGLHYMCSFKHKLMMETATLLGFFTNVERKLYLPTVST